MPRRHTINKAIDIIEGLRNALEFSQGGDIAVSLNDLYLYMVQRLSTANLKNDPAILDEVTALLRELLGAWEVLAKGTADGIDDDSTAPNDGNVLTKA